MPCCCRPVPYLSLFCRQAAATLKLAHVFHRAKLRGIDQIISATVAHYSHAYPWQSASVTNVLVLKASKCLQSRICSARCGLHVGRSLQHLVSRAHLDQCKEERPDISLLRPALQKQWDHAANAHLGNIVVKPQSRKKASWKCDACPDGHPHQWLATVCNRTNGNGCPQCSGYQVCKHNCLTTIAEWAAAQWDYEAILTLGTPDSIVAYSNKSAGWRCQGCGHRWTVAINHHVRGQSGCPKCAPRGPVTIQPLQSVSTRS